MGEIVLRLTQLGDALFARSAVTLGAHETLPYVPGSLLLGAAASRLYDALGDRAFDVFHAGAVRFLDGLPLSPEGTPYLPAPHAWVYPKSAGLDDGSGRVREARVPGRATAEQDGGLAFADYRAVREEAVTIDGLVWKPRTLMRMKSSADREGRGRPAEGLLFSYQVHPAGSRWLARIVLDDDVPAEVDAALRSTFDRQEVWLGRSRGAELGRMQAEVLEPRPPVWRTPGSAPDARQAWLLLMSDLAPEAAEGAQPSLTLGPEALGLPAGWRLDLQRTHVRTRRYAPWNSKRQARDLERQVLVRGGVLVYSGLEPLAPDARAALAQRIRSGVGLYRHDGLGELWLDPPWLATFAWSASDRSSGAIGGPALQRAPQLEGPWAGLGAWMEREAAHALSRQRVSEEAVPLSRSILAGLRGARRRGDRTPSRSQWRRLAALLDRWMRLPADARPALAAHVDEVVFRQASGSPIPGIGGNLWQAHVHLDAHSQPLAEYVAGLLRPPPASDANEVLDRALLVAVTSSLVAHGLMGASNGGAGAAGPSGGGQPQ